MLDPSHQGDLNTGCEIRQAAQRDLSALLTLENSSFIYDRLSKRSFQHWLKAPHGVFLVAEVDNIVVGYGLVIMRKGTRLARLYSIAIDGNCRGKGVGKTLLLALEEATLEQGKLFMRLEVAHDNAAAIALYERLGYRTFGIYPHYYAEDVDALRMQKSIKQSVSQKLLDDYPWFQQTTDFTCGPAALLMAMASLDKTIEFNQEHELDIWREATTIFMTSGHGGCHPLGLALAAAKRQFSPQVYINTSEPLFIEGVRSEHKKQILTLVDKQFFAKCQNLKIPVYYHELSLEAMAQHLLQGDRVICLISTYQLDGMKTPHWVTVTNIDQDCLYIHDSDVDDNHPTDADNQHIPIAREDYAKFASYGKARLRTAIVLKK